MKGDIALAGFVLTAAEWDELDTWSRTQLMVAATGRDDLWVVAEISNVFATRDQPPHIGSR
jgi:uncharacterized protein YlxP (DUF503 family)